MKKLHLFNLCLSIVFGLAWGIAPGAMAKELSPPVAGGGQEQRRNFDWIQHTQRTLDELKDKLNLSTEQMPAWDTWSRGVIKDAQQQIDRRKAESGKKAHAEKSMVEETTPDQMAAGIVRLRAETTWMQEHLIQLEAAQIRTKAFYNALNVNQRTIFDLFWHELHHRVSGHDSAWDVHESNEPGRGQ